MLCSEHQRVSWENFWEKNNFENLWDFKNQIFKTDILGTDANGNKINGRHPQRRLQSINKFLCKWFNDNVGGAKADRMCDRLTNQIEQYDNAFNRPTCAFFDPSIKNGGPNPDECK